MTRDLFTVTAATSCAMALAACGGMPMPMKADSVAQAAWPAAVRVPAGHAVALESVGAGNITYECREKTGAAGQHEWVFVGPSATLTNRQGQAIGRYDGPPATWTAMDGSAVTGVQLAVAPAGDGNIPLQLVKANPATGMGAMTGVSYVQRVATQGGTAPSMACNGDAKGRRETVKYRADYIFWKPA